MTDVEVLIQQIITGLSNGMIIALIAIGYSMVYGIIELINFAHGDLFMLGSFFALTILAALGYPSVDPSVLDILPLLILVPLFCGILNWLIDRIAYRPIRNSPRLAPFVSAIGVSFVLLNIGLLWGGIPLEVFNFGRSASSPKNFPELVGFGNILGESNIQFTQKDLIVWCVTIPLIFALTLIIKKTKMGTAMRAVAQNPIAARLMGINVDKVISFTFVLGGILAGVSSVIYALYNNTIYFQMGYRVGIDAFTAAVLGGIGNLPGTLLGALLIGLTRAFSDQYLATEWTNVVVFSMLILVLTFKPAGLLGFNKREKV